MRIREMLLLGRLACHRTAANTYGLSLEEREKRGKKKSE